MITNIIMAIVVMYTMRLQYKYYVIERKKEAIEEKLVEKIAYIFFFETIYKTDDKIKEEAKRYVQENKESFMKWWNKDDNK